MIFNKPKGLTAGYYRNPVSDLIYLWSGLTWSISMIDRPDEYAQANGLTDLIVIPDLTSRVLFRSLAMHALERWSVEINFSESKAFNAFDGLIPLAASHCLSPLSPPHFDGSNFGDLRHRPSFSPQRIEPLLSSGQLSSFCWHWFLKSNTKDERLLLYNTALPFWFCSEKQLLMSIGSYGTPHRSSFLCSFFHIFTIFFLLSAWDQLEDDYNDKVTPSQFKITFTEYWLWQII
jgi:hypothetical protein